MDKFTTNFCAPDRVLITIDAAVTGFLHKATQKGPKALTYCHFERQREIFVVKIPRRLRFSE